MIQILRQGPNLNNKPQPQAQQSLHNSNKSALTEPI